MFQSFKLATTCCSFLLGTALTLSACSDDNSTSVNNSDQSSENTITHKPYMRINKCEDSALQKKTVLDALDSLTYIEPITPGRFDWTNIHSCGNCAGGQTLYMIVSDYCEFEADIKIEVSNDTLVITYENLANVSKCTCQSKHTIEWAPDVNYARLNGVTYKVYDCPYQIVCSNISR